MLKSVVVIVILIDTDTELFIVLFCGVGTLGGDIQAHPFDIIKVDAVKADLDIIVHQGVIDLNIGGSIDPAPADLQFFIHKIAIVIKEESKGILREFKITEAVFLGNVFDIPLIDANGELQVSCIAHDDQVIRTVKIEANIASLQTAVITCEQPLITKRDADALGLGIDILISGVCREGICIMDALHGLGIIFRRTHAEAENPADTGQKTNGGKFQNAQDDLPRFWPRGTAILIPLVIFAVAFIIRHACPPKRHMYTTIIVYKCEQVKQKKTKDSRHSAKRHEKVAFFVREALTRGKIMVIIVCMVMVWAYYALMTLLSRICGGDTVKLDLRAMLAGECRTLTIDYTLMPQFDPDDQRSNLWGVRFHSPMEVKGEIVNTAGYMRMHVDLSLDYTAPCARCLTDVRGNFSFSLEKTVAPRNLLEGLGEDALDDYAIVEDGFLDMDEQLLELVEMEFPTRILCRDDCRGLCDKCGKDLNEGDCDCKAELDPRLAPLAAMLQELKERENNDQ